MQLQVVFRRRTPGYRRLCAASYFSFYLETPEFQKVEDTTGFTSRGNSISTYRVPKEMAETEGPRGIKPVVSKKAEFHDGIRVKLNYHAA